MTSQIHRIKEHFKALGFTASDIRAKVTKNKHGENIGTQIRVNDTKRPGLRHRIFRYAPQLAKMGYNVHITFFNGKLLHISITEAPYGKKGFIDYGQLRIMLDRYIKSMKDQGKQ